MIFTKNLSGDSRLTITLTVNEVKTTDNKDYDITNNTSDVSYSLVLSKTGGSAYDLYEESRCRVTINGSDVFNKLISYDLRNKTSQTLASGYVRKIKHDDDGTKKINVSGYLDLSSNSKGSATASGTMELKVIPRMTNCPKLTGDIESIYFLPLNPALPNAKHSLKVTFGSLTGYVNEMGIIQNQEFILSNYNIPVEFNSSIYDQFTGKSITGKMVLTTYDSDDTKIGTTEADITANCNADKCSPYAVGSIEDVNTVTTALTGNSKKIVKGFSNGKITLTTLRASNSTLDKNSSITARLINGNAFSGTTYTINGITNSVVTLLLTNSRGFSTTYTIGDLSNLINYFQPLIALNAERLNSTSNTVNLTYSGTFFNQSFGKVANTLALKWFYKSETDTSFKEGGTITPTISGNNITEKTITLNGSFSYQSNYRFKIEATDKLGAFLIEDPVTAGIPNYDWGKNHFEHNTNLYCNKDLEVTGSMSLGSGIVLPLIKVGEWEG